MVLTDGNFAKNPGFNNDSTLLHMAASLNSENVTVFFFSLGVNMTPDPLLELRSLSCMMNSTVTYVTLVDAQRNPHWAIRPYFDYQATLRTAANSSFWTETYDDFDGLGLVATVTYPGKFPKSLFTNPLLGFIETLGLLKQQTLDLPICVSVCLSVLCSYQ